MPLLVFSDGSSEPPIFDPAPERQRFPANNVLYHAGSSIGVSSKYNIGLFPLSSRLRCGLGP